MRIEASKRQFCSRLVALAYCSAGYDLVNIKRPEYCTPGQLERCQAFERVDGIVRVATRDEVLFAETEDPNEIHWRQTFLWLGQVRASVRGSAEHRQTDIQTIADVSIFLLANPQFDEEFSGYVARSGYLEFYELDIQLNRYRYDLDLFAQNLLCNHDSAADIIDFEIEKEGPLCERFSIMFDKFERLYRREKLDFFEIHLNLYAKLLMQVDIRVSVICQAIEQMRLIHMYPGISQMAVQSGRLVAKVRRTLKALGLA